MSPRFVRFSRHRPSRGAKVLRVAVATGLAAIAAVVAGCGRVEGATHWEEALHGAGSPAPKTHPAAAEQVYPVPKPPFSEGIFPCSRCHEGGAPAKDERPAMPHAVHLAKGLECADCHAPDDADGPPRIPAREVCDTCHGDPAKLSPGATAYFAAVTRADGATEFPRRWKTRDTLPQHERHAKAGIACAKCHGEPSDAPFARPRAVALMDRCVSCHEESKASVKCESCHTATTRPQHANIVLHHAEDQRGCLDCHDADDRDVLRLANGTKVTFEESFKLCGQCHGTQLRDWKIGLHGRRTGSWNGRREYRLCVHCHWPHAPKFQPMAPAPRPARPEEVR